MDKQETSYCANFNFNSNITSMFFKNEVHKIPEKKVNWFIGESNDVFTIKK